MTLADRIKRHEGYSETPYRDTRGFWTVGWGHLIHHIRPQPWATLGDLLEHLCEKDTHEKWFAQDLARAEADAMHYITPELFTQLSTKRREVLIEMAFQLGGAGLRKFVKLKEAIQAGRWVMAEAEILNSALAQQTPNRARYYAASMLEG